VQSAEKEDHIDLMRAMLTGLKDAFVKHAELQKDRAADATASLKETLRDYLGPCRGQKNGDSWKESFSESTPIAKILEAAFKPKTGLLAGPGPKVMSTKKELKDALDTYDQELAKWGAEAMRDDGLVTKLNETSDFAQVTAFESHLCRCLRKPVEAQLESVQKYMTLFASVPSSAVLPQLWKAAQDILAKK
jgi:hypothetical protein